MSGTTFNNDGTIVQFYTVEATGTYDITAFGGQGGQGGSDSASSGGTGGLGAEIGGDFSLTTGEVLQIVVGGYGNGAGGGGSFVIETFNGTSTVDIPLVIAGGGGAFNNNLPGYQGGSGQIGGSGQTGSYGGGVGGSGGSGGAGSGKYGGGGGGYSGGNGAGGTSDLTQATGESARSTGYGGGGRRRPRTSSFLTRCVGAFGLAITPLGLNTYWMSGCSRHQGVTAYW
jgi:hypothetical protein